MRGAASSGTRPRVGGPARCRLTAGHSRPSRSHRLTQTCQFLRLVRVVARSRRLWQGSADVRFLTDVAAPCHAASRRALGVVDRTTRTLAALGRRRRRRRAALRRLGEVGHQLKFSGPVCRHRLAARRDGDRVPSIRGLSAWPGVLLGDLSQQLRRASRPRGSRADLRNMIEVLAAAALVRRASRGGSSALDTMSGVARLVFALVLGTALRRRSGRLALSQGALVAHSADGRPNVVARRFHGAIVLVPLALGLGFRPNAPSTQGARVEAVLTIAVVATSTESASRSNEPLDLNCFPALGRRLFASGSVARRCGQRLRGRHRLVGDPQPRPIRVGLITRTVLSTQRTSPWPRFRACSRRLGLGTGSVCRTTRAVSPRALGRRGRAAPDRAKPARRRCNSGCWRSPSAFGSRPSALASRETE